MTRYDTPELELPQNMEVTFKRLLLSELMFIMVGLGLWLDQILFRNLDPDWNLPFVGSLFFT